MCTDLKIPGQYDNPLYLNSVERVVKAGVKAGKPIGIGGIGGRQDLLEKFFTMGATWSLSGADGAMLQAGMKKLGQEYAAMNARVQSSRKATVENAVESAATESKVQLQSTVVEIAAATA